MRLVSAPLRARTGARFRSREERASSLLELVVTATVVLSSVLATVAVVDGSARAVVAGDRRREATALAVAELEAMRVLPADQLGFAPTTAGVEAAFEGRDTVRLAGGGVQPATTMVHDGTSYDIRRWVTWEALDSAGRRNAQGVKHLTVEVRWDDRSVRQDTGVAPPSAPTCVRAWTDPVVAGPSANGYVALTGIAEAGATVVAVGPQRSGPMPAPGDLLLVVQMTGPAAGRFEYALAGSGVDGGGLFVSGTGPGGGLLHSYVSDADSAAQVVRVPTVERLQVPRLEAPPFDGHIGGVVAVDVTAEVIGPLVVDLEGRGASVAVDAETRAAVALAPGGGLPGAPGGGVLALRSPTLRGPLEVRAAGALGGGDGGSVLLQVGSGAEGAVVRAPGGPATSGAGGSGGRVWSSTRPAVADVAGGAGAPPGATGVVDPTLRDVEVPGLPGRAGCFAALSVTKSTPTPVVATAGGGTARWTIRVANAPDRGVAGSVRLRDPLGPGLAFAATEEVRLEGGATRDDVVDPEPFAPAPSWGSFTLPPGSALEVTLRVTVADGLQGVVGNDAVVDADSGDVALHAGYGQAQSTAEDVTLRAFPCDTPWTDPDPGLLTAPPNSYLPLTVPVGAGSTALSVGPQVGSSAVRAGDLLLVVQMTGPSAGRYEYAVASAVEAGRVRIDGAGAGGGLVGAYGADGAAQLVRVPTYPSVVLATTVRPPSWNGSTGGVLALDVTGTFLVQGGALDASAAGPAGRGGAGADGGMVLVRAGGVAGSGTLRASGADGSGAGGRGGTVVSVALSASVDGLVIEARGGAGSRSPGAGGAVVMSGPAASVDVTGGAAGAAQGTVLDDARPADTRGVGLGVGCRPVLSVSVSSPSPGLWRVRDATAPMVLTVTNLAGRPAVRSAGLSAWLPRGVEVVSTDAVELLGGASRSGAGRDPDGSSGAAEWSGFDLPGGASAVVRASIGFPGVDPGGVQVTASARGDGPTGSVSVAGVQAADYLLTTVVSRRSPTAARSTLSGGSTVWPVATGVLPAVPSGPTVTVGVPSLLLPPETAVVDPQPTRARVGVVVAPTSPSAQVCLFAEVVDLLSGTTVGSGGALGSATAPAACVGPAASPVELEVPSRLWSAQSLGQVGVRWHLWSPQGASAQLANAWFAFDWQDGTWSTPASVVSGSLPGGDRREPLASPDGVAVAFGGLPREPDPNRVVDLATAVPLAGDAVAQAPVAVVVWRPSGGSRVCLRAQWTLDGAPVGSLTAPVCRSSGGWSTERFAPGPVAAGDVARLGLRLLPDSQKPSAQLELDAVEVEVTWWRR